MSKQHATKAAPVCPTCGSTKAIPIVYGLPTYDTFLEAKQGKFTLGGCMISEESPRWECPDCHERFGQLFSEKKSR